MKIRIIGSQYVGLITVAFFVKIVFGTTFVDVDQSNIDKLKNR